MSRAERFWVSVGEGRAAAYRWRARGRGPTAMQRRALLAHGWESRAGRLAVWVDPLLAAGYEVVAYDAPAHGASPGRRADPLTMVRTIEAVLGVSGPADVWIGHSLGGFASILALGAGERIQPPVARVARSARRLVVVAGAESGVDAMGMFCQVLGLGERFLPLLLQAAAEVAGGPIASFDLHRVFPDTEVPTLWLHDPEDPEVPFEGAERVARTCSHVRLEEVPGLGHHRIARDHEVIDRALAFLEEPAVGR